MARRSLMAPTLLLTAVVGLTATGCGSTLQAGASGIAPGPTTSTGLRPHGAGHHHAPRHRRASEPRSAAPTGLTAPPVPMASTSSAPTLRPMPTSATSKPQHTHSSAPPVVVPTCQTASLTLSVTGVRETASSFLTDLAVTNHSRHACEVQGWPGVVLRGNATLNACAVSQQTPDCGGPVSKDNVDSPAPVPTGSAPPSVLLAPGKDAPFSLVWHGVVCMTPAYRTEITLPGDPGVLGVVFPADTNPCLLQPNDPGNETILVTPFGSHQPTA